MHTFAEPVGRSAGAVAVGTLAAAMMIRHGELVIWKHPEYIRTTYDQRVIDTWVRLQIVRGRRFGTFSVSELLLSRQPTLPLRAEDATPT